MEGLRLKDFIQQSLVEICEAISEAREERVEIAPKLHESLQGAGMKHSDVEFDLAVTVENNEGREVKAEVGATIISVVSFGAKASASAKEDKNVSTISRIKFSVPVYLMYKSHEKQKAKPIAMKNRRAII
jgi:hypothetical protein